jgi:hypothetical protein
MELFRNMAPTAPAAAGTAWNAATNYPLNSLASFGGMLYQSTRFPGNTGKQPNLNGDFWSPAMTIQPANTTSMGKTAALWNNTTTYNPGDIVTRAIGKGPASAYICIQTNVNSPPTLAAASLLNWQRVLQPGMLLEVINPGGVSEVVSVISVGAANTALANTFTAEFKNVYSPNSTIICRGNPGPQATYNPRKDNNVVLHLSLIQ